MSKKVYTNRVFEKIPFNSEQRADIEAGNLSVVTRNGYPVDIIRWDLDSRFPIVAVCTYCGSQGQMVVQADRQGRVSNWREDAFDLFVVPSVNSSALGIDSSVLENLEKYGLTIVSKYSMPHWIPIKKGERLPCHAYLWNDNFDKRHQFFEGSLYPTIPGVQVGTDTWYLPTFVVHDLPRE